ncbi:twin-arginine translocase subunit TatC [Moorena sp. SIO3E8]|uniref:twin-arginine translocase subunit TatC n=1 Tax=Moorena sp. SIO3E8 TaxID=2607830 RepID=UPI0025F0308C|nr:twin-arginine translocase subunit TatC [Moorena sp. SIO3E8]
MAENTIDDSKMPLLDHLIELRKRLLICVALLIVAFLIAFAFSRDIFNFLALPLAETMELRGVEGFERRMIFTGLPEVFFTQVKVAFFAGAFACVPVFLIQIWMFVAPGLYNHEKKAIAPFLVATPILFFIGGSLVYFVIFPVASEFFISFEQAAGDGELAIQLEPKVDQYLSLMIQLIFAFGLSFELPVLLTLLAKVGIVSADGLAAKRKYAIVGVFVVAAIFTPPDPISQLLLAIPIILLYEVSILLARLVEKKREEDAQSEDSSAS